MPPGMARGLCKAVTLPVSAHRLGNLHHQHPPAFRQQRQLPLRRGQAALERGLGHELAALVQRDVGTEP